jgi:hypothetical protein
MRIEVLAEKIGAKIINPAAGASRPVERVYAGDRMSDLLNQASASTLVVTNLATSQLIRVASLMDLPAICLVNGVIPEPALVAAASESGTALMVSPFDMFETCGRLYECVRNER